MTSPVATAVVLAMLAIAAPGAAQPAAGDACTTGLARERAGALPGAFIALERCLARGAPSRGDAEEALRRVKKRLAAGDYAPVSFSLQPASAEVRIAPFTESERLR